MSLGLIISEARKQLGLTFRSLSQATGIDLALLSKYEKQERIPSKNHLQLLIEELKLDETETRTVWLAEKIYDLLDENQYSIEALQLAEKRVQYQISEKHKVANSFPKDLEALIGELNLLQANWSAKKPLNATQLRKMEEYFNLSYTYESNRIEGNTLTLQETHLVLNEGITISGKSMREHLEAINHAEAITYLSELVSENVEFNERVLKQIHYLVLKMIDRENAGQYRTIGVRINGSQYLPPEPYLLGRLMEEVFEYYEANKKLLHPVILAAEMHERIVRIHPFVDGNGRTCRLVMNLILLQNGFTIANLKGDLSNRLKYYEALENAISDERHTFRLLIAETAVQSLKEHLELTS